MRLQAPILLAAALAAALPAAAQSYSDPGTGYGADAGYARGHDAESGGATGGIHARLRLTGGIGLEVSAGYRHDSFATDGARALTVDEIPIATSLLVFFPHDGRVQPYLLAGIAYT
ncbi:MAG: outer membrane beta-barrel protein, partial [Thermoanaerobaculia bacterium]